MIRDPHGVVHATYGDDTLCYVYWYIQATSRVRSGWSLPTVRVVTCLACLRYHREVV